MARGDGNSGVGYDPRRRADDFHVQYVVNTSGDRFFIPYNDNASMADQLAQCKTMSGKTTTYGGGDVVGVELVDT